MRSEAYISDDALSFLWKYMQHLSLETALHPDKAEQ